MTISTMWCRAYGVLAATSVLAACGDAGEGATDAGGGSAARPALAAVTDGKPKDWAVDVCKTFPVAAASKASGLAIKETNTSHTNANDTDVGSCTYSGEAYDELFTVGLRHAHDPDMTVEEQIASVTSEPEITGPSEEVTMSKGKAVWSPKLRTLTWVTDPARMVIVTPPYAVTFGSKPPKLPDAELRANAIAIAKAVEG